MNYIIINFSLLSYDSYEDMINGMILDLLIIRVVFDQSSQLQVYANWNTWTVTLEISINFKLAYMLD